MNKLIRRFLCWRNGHFWTDGVLNDYVYCMRCPKKIRMQKLIDKVTK